MKRNETDHGFSRRSFLRKTSLAAATVAGSRLITPVYGQGAPSANVVGANNKLTIGFVGLGNQGLNSHLKPILKASQENNVTVAALCDVSKTRIGDATKAVAEAGGKAESYDDYRKLLERKDVDVIVCATVDHWHGRVSVDALNAGKHVYVEKPMTRYLGEAFEVYDTVKKTGKLLQVGSQGCSDMKWHKAAEWIKAGRIGPVVMMQGSYMRNTPKGEWNGGPCSPQTWATEEDINWKLWLGQQIKSRKDFSKDDYFRWRKYYPYCAGLLSDLFPHKLHPYLLASASTEFPSRVASVGSKAFHTDSKTPEAPERDVPEIVQVIADFPNGMTMNMCSSSVNEQGTQEMIRGHKGTLVMGGNRVQLTPERPFAEEIDPDTSEEFPPELIPNHHKNLFDSIRGSAKLNCPVDLAVRVQTIVSLAEMSERLNIVCLFDEKTRKVSMGDGAGGRKEIAPITYGTLTLS